MGRQDRRIDGGLIAAIVAMALMFPVLDFALRESYAYPDRMDGAEWVGLGALVAAVLVALVVAARMPRVASSPSVVRAVVLVALCGVVGWLTGVRETGGAVWGGVVGAGAVGLVGALGLFAQRVGPRARGKAAAAGVGDVAG